MKTTSRWNYRSIVGKAMMGLVLAAMVGSINVASSFGDDDHGRGGRHDSGNRGRGHDNGRYEHRGRGYDHDRYARGRRGYPSYGYGYSGPVYVPPPVYYEPSPPPGLHIFLPL
jgi:hypothetical protein